MLPPAKFRLSSKKTSSNRGLSALKHNDIDLLTAELDAKVIQVIDLW